MEDKQTASAENPTGKLRTGDLTQGPILSKVLFFSMPILLGNLFNTLYSVVNSIVVGQYVGSDALAAVGSSFALSMVIIAIYAGFGMGSGILVAQLFGAKSKDLTKTVNTAYIIALFVGITMSILGQFIAKPVLMLLNTPANILGDALIYLRIFFIGCTGQLFYFMGSSMLRSLGDSKWPMYFLIFCSVLNILFGLTFVLLFNMGVAGVAWSTVLAQSISAVFVVARTYKSKKYGLNVTKENFKPDFRILKMILKIGIPSAISQLVSSIGLLILQSFSNAFGSDFVATTSIMQRVDTIAVMPIMAINGGLAVFAGQCLGAGDEKRVREGFKKIGIVAVLTTLVLATIIFLCSGVIGHAFTSNEKVIATTTVAVQIIAFFYTIQALQFVFTGMLTGASAMIPQMIISIFGISLRVILSYFLAVRTGNRFGLFWAQDIVICSTALLFVLYVKFGNWKKYIAVHRKEAPVLTDITNKEEILESQTP